jgi:putative FmdB family regulatory protein
MPIYEYRCQSCGKVSSFFVRSIGGEVNAVCGYCQSAYMERRMSSFTMGKTTSSVHEAFPSGSEHHSPEYYQDPRNIGRGVEAAFVKHGMDMPQSVRDNIDAARQGETPKGLDL